MVLTIDAKYEVDMSGLDEDQLEEFFDSIEDIECIYVYNHDRRLLTIFGLRKL
jgi:hypothetical protein